MKKNSLFLASIIGLALSGAVLILLIPGLFNSPGQGTLWMVSIMGVLVVLFAVGTRYWKTTT
ncbi:hypothetical protein [Tessaracoccus antarcticus]|uniref:Uncharacterized protein n=1 Tax=Tessaracoccus antarcticus TaxID=2479848 RepID=A0A3M0G5H3_9ACTN|nr:hypothetical protein [Tessaracoccus antarcticus]RMB60135.1 hypothetical protein EAX62_10600 [Tessaracoccus antarcticus]